MAKSKLDDDFHSYLVKDVSLTEKEKFPILMKLDNVEIPKGLIPFEKAKKCNVDSNKRMYIHFYQHDKTFSDILTSTKKYLKLLQSFDGVITPDCSLLIGQAPCLQKAARQSKRSYHGLHLARTRTTWGTTPKSAL